MEKNVAFLTVQVAVNACFIYVITEFYRLISAPYAFIQLPQQLHIRERSLYKCTMQKWAVSPLPSLEGFFRPPFFGVGIFEDPFPPQHMQGVHLNNERSLT